MKTRMTLLSPVVSLSSSVVMAQNRPLLVKAFRRDLEADGFTGCKGPDKNALMKYSAGLYVPAGWPSFQRINVMSDIIRINSFVRLVRGGLKMEIS
jgi:hypothetical protein